MDYFDAFGALGASYWLLMGGALLAFGFVKWAATRMKETIGGPGSVPASSGFTGAAVAKRLLEVVGLKQVAVVGGGRLNCYDPRRREIHLRDETYNGTTLAASAVAAHEVGHAQQFAEGYWAARLRQFIWPMRWVLLAAVAALLALSFTPFRLADVTGWILGIGVAILLLQVPVVLPLELDATRRARALVVDAGLLNPVELPTFDRVLGSAARTYYALEGGRWIVLLVVAGTLLAGSSGFAIEFGDEPVPERPVAAEPVPPPPPPPVQPTPEELARAQEQIDLLSPWLSSAMLVPIIFFVVLLAIRFQGTRRREPSLKDRATLRNNAGLAYYQHGQWGAAIEEYNAALVLDPAQVAARMNRGTCYLRLNKLEEALTDFNATVFLAPGFADAIAARGEIHGRMGKFDLALADFEEAMRLAPHNTTGLNLRGHLWIKRGELDRALADFERALALNPRDPLAFHGRAVVRMARQDPAGALADCEQALACGFDPAGARMLRGQIRLHKNDLDAAIEDFNAVLKDNPAQAAVLRDRGLAWLFKGVLYRAAADLDESLRLDPTDAVAFNNRGVVFLKAGEYGRALADLQKAIELDAKFANPHRHLAWLQTTCPQAEFRNGAEAFTHATRALELCDWKNNEWLGVLAAAYAEAGDFEQAVHWQAKCLSGSSAEARPVAEERLTLYQARLPFRDQPVGITWSRPDA